MKLKNFQKKNKKVYDNLNLKFDRLCGNMKLEYHTIVKKFFGKIAYIYQYLNKTTFQVSSIGIL